MNSEQKLLNTVSWICSEMNKNPTIRQRELLRTEAISAVYLYFGDKVGAKQCGRLEKKETGKQ
jgi:hypothetical protein